MSDKTLSVVAVRYFVLATKVLPILIAFIHFLNTALSFFGIYDIPLNYLGGISLFPILYLYLASYTFKLCSYYRMFLHYTIAIDALNLYDCYAGISIETYSIYSIHVILTILTLFIIIYLKFFNKKK